MKTNGIPGSPSPDPIQNPSDYFFLITSSLIPHMHYCLINPKSNPIPIFLKNIHNQNSFWATQNKASKIVLFFFTGRVPIFRSGHSLHSYHTRLICFLCSFLRFFFFYPIEPENSL